MSNSVLYDVPGPKARRRSLIFSIVGVLFILGLAALLFVLTATWHREGR